MNDSNAEILRAALLFAVGQGYATLVIDLSDTDFCDLTAFRELERAHQRACAVGGELRLVLPGSGQVLEITGSDKAIRLYPTIDAALALGAPPPADRLRRPDMAAWACASPAVSDLELLRGAQSVLAQRIGADEHVWADRAILVLAAGGAARRFPGTSGLPGTPRALHGELAV